MLGHSLPESLYSEIKDKKKVFVVQNEGKPQLSDNVTDTLVGIVLYKSDEDIFSISEEERKEMNDLKVPFVTLGSSKDISEVFIPDRFFENSKLVNRPFLHGMFDCYTLIRDYYRRNFNIILPTNLQRNWEWWTEGSNLYVDNAKKYGFEEVQDIKIHDVLIMNINSQVPNHGAIYLGDNKILHHIGGRFSTEETLKSSYKHNLAVIYRNKNIR
jgi:cell wall-associated NlpC family hydrolase